MEQPIKKYKFSRIFFGFVHKRSGNEIKFDAKTYQLFGVFVNQTWNQGKNKKWDEVKSGCFKSFCNTEEKKSGVISRWRSESFSKIFFVPVGVIFLFSLSEKLSRGISLAMLLSCAFSYNYFRGYVSARRLARECCIREAVWLSAGEVLARGKRSSVSSGDTWLAKFLD